MSWSKDSPGHTRTRDCAVQGHHIGPQLGFFFLVNVFIKPFDLYKYRTGQQMRPYQSGRLCHTLKDTRLRQTTSKTMSKVLHFPICSPSKYIQTSTKKYKPNKLYDNIKKGGGSRCPYQQDKKGLPPLETTSRSCIPVQYRNTSALMPCMSNIL